MLLIYAIDNHAHDSRITLSTNGTVQTLNARMGTGGGNVPMLLYPRVTGALCAAGYSKLGLQEACNGMYTVSSSWEGTQVSPTLTANNAGGNQRKPDKGNFTSIIQQNEKQYVVRRLTPKECCRLQGFPDWWEDGAEGSDTNRYKMWGNGVALPCVFDLLRRLAEEGEET